MYTLTRPNTYENFGLLQLTMPFQNPLDYVSQELYHQGQSNTFMAATAWEKKFVFLDRVLDIVRNQFLLSVKATSSISK